MECERSHFLKSIIMKVNVIAYLEFESAYYNIKENKKRKQKKLGEEEIDVLKKMTKIVSKIFDGNKKNGVAENRMRKKE